MPEYTHFHDGNYPCREHIETGKIEFYMNDKWCDINHPGEALCDKGYVQWSDVNKAVVELKDNHGMRFEKVGYDIVAMKVNLDEMLELAKDQTKAHAIVQADRPGGEFFAQYLEQTHFTPDTPANQEYEYRLFRWEKMMYSIMSIPVEKKHLFAEAAKESKLKVQDAIPLTFGMVRASTRPDRFDDRWWGGKTPPEEEYNEVKKDLKWFPLDSPTTCTLESDDELAYKGPGGHHDLHTEFNYKLKTLLEERGIKWEDFMKQREFND